MIDDEVSLWSRVRQGDERALTALFDRHEARLFRHASRIVSVREDAKDAVVVAFFELWRNRASVRLVDGSPLPWLLSTVSNAARNLERSARRYRSLLGRVPHEHRDASIVLSDESGVLAALDRLPARDRAVVVLAVLEGYAERETAEALGIPRGTVKSRLARARAILREQMSVLEGAVR